MTGEIRKSSVPSLKIYIEGRIFNLSGTEAVRVRKAMADRVKRMARFTKDMSEILPHKPSNQLSGWVTSPTSPTFRGGPILTFPTSVRGERAMALIK